MRFLRHLLKLLESPLLTSKWATTATSWGVLWASDHVYNDHSIDHVRVCSQPEYDFYDITWVAASKCWLCGTFWDSGLWRAN